MALLKEIDDSWTFTRGKHQGERLEDVVKDDPSYLQWVFEKATDGMSDEAFHALEDIMEENDIEFP